MSENIAYKNRSDDEIHIANILNDFKCSIDKGFYQQFEWLDANLDDLSYSTAKAGVADWLGEQLKDSQENRKHRIELRYMRRNYATQVIAIVKKVLICWIAAFALAGISNVLLKKPFLSDQALSTLTKGSTANVFAALILIGGGLFPFESKFLKRLQRAIQ